MGISPDDSWPESTSSFNEGQHYFAQTSHEELNTNGWTISGQIGDSLSPVGPAVVPMTCTDPSTSVSVLGGGQLAPRSALQEPLEQGWEEAEKTQAHISGSAVKDSNGSAFVLF